MADEQPTGAQAATSGDVTPAGETGAQAAQTPATTTPATTTPASSTKSQLNLDDALDALRKAREEAAATRVKLKAFEEAQAAAELAKLSETERLQKQYADLQAQVAQQQTQAQERIVRAEVKAAASEAGIKPALAARLIDYAEIEYDADSGEPKNIAALLKQLVTDYPELAQPAPAAQQQQQQHARASAGAPASPSRSATTSGAGLTREIIATMTPAEHAARRVEVYEWLRTHPNG